MFERICTQGKLTEADAVETMRATLVRLYDLSACEDKLMQYTSLQTGVKYLHDNGVVHRDCESHFTG